ncbi:MAG: AbrB/MazE/SpoVT family DNA-binding domain-containing protein [Pseudomonadota bacterium]|nr:AbrB/MazE/SpoVT family DNA-binding domain-containing protein [Pseudomonadota bacterium]
MVAATMTSKGQITIPAEVRKRLRLKAGSKVDFIENRAGELVLKPRIGDIRSLRGIVKYDGPPVSIEEMDEAIGEAVVERFLRSSK